MVPGTPHTHPVAAGPAGKGHDAMAQKGSAGTPSLTSAAVERLHILLI